MNFGRFLGFLHPALVHFPLVLLVVSVGLELVGFLRRSVRFTWAAQILLVPGTVAMLFAFVAGNFAEIWAARDGIPQEPMEQHELLATITSWAFVFLTAGRLFLGVTARRRWMAVYLAAALLACILLGITGHRGAMLVYERGAGVQQAMASTPPVPTQEDLAVLRQKQDPDALFYSDRMHHLFGWMVLGLSGMLLLDLLSPRAGERLRKVGPLLLLIGGAFLMVYSDTDSWPLSAQRPITDKEVLMHKIYAALMLLVGLRGLFPRRTGSATPRAQGRTMAVFALIGGALLFTHVHSNAPYANVAVGVYAHHTVMGFIALTIGAVRLLEDALKERELPRLRRGLAWAYPCLMLTESVFLIKYNEGLPWFLGYRALSLAAPHKGLIAPFGRERAELTFDPNLARLDLYILDQANNRSRPIQADTIPLIVRVGTEATAVPLAATPGDRSHFTGTATFLRGAPLFQARALGPSGRAAAGGELVADFEPWTDSRAIDTRTTAAFLCPMHPSVGAASAGRCPVCGMALAPNRTPRPWNRLHDDGYRMDLALAAPAARRMSEKLASVDPRAGAAARDALEGAFEPIAAPMPGRTVRLTLTPRRSDGSPITELEVVHTRKLHLIVVGEDLNFFDHVHPAPQPDGSLRLEYRFPTAGAYVLFADLTPQGDRNQVFRLPVAVSGPAPQHRPLIETPAPAIVRREYRVALLPAPSPIRAGEETSLTFTISQNATPVTDIEPYLGAGGHCVVVSEDSQAYLHSHPLETSGSRFGPRITFHTLFPHPGLYKIWAQFQHHGRPLIFDFVVRVE